MFNARESSVITKRDPAGKYEVEIFGCQNPKKVIVCSHGNGVRRWDGEKFFYAVAAHYKDSIVMLVDQNQPYKDGCKLNTLEIMVGRVQGLIGMALKSYPGIPVIVLGHSMGCGVVSQLGLQNVSKVIFVAPTAGAEKAKLLSRYGKDILNGKVVKTSDGLTKFLGRDYIDSVISIVWEDEYLKLLKRYKNVYVFESGDEEIVGKERFKHRQMPFAGYEVIPGATHNLHAPALINLFAKLDNLI